MENTAGCSAWEAQGQPMETNCIPRLGWKRGWPGYQELRKGIRLAFHTCH